MTASLYPIQKQAILERTVSDGLLDQLVNNGVRYLFSNSGTDFTPIILALHRRKQAGKEDLSIIVAPHENTLVSMAHGYFLLSHQMQAVMAHVGVGTANVGLGIINARRSRIPVLVMAGVTPYTETPSSPDYTGYRTNFVQWGQDTFDQGAYFREFTKWDYQLKTPLHMRQVFKRAFAVAQSTPAGPVYLMLPKEILCASDMEKEFLDDAPQAVNSIPFPDEEIIEQIAKLISAAKKPLILVAELGRYEGGAEVLEKFAVTFGIPVVEFGKRNFLNLSTECSMHLGFWPSPWLEESDLIIALENIVPYIPSKTKLTKLPKTIHIAIDPLFQDIPLRSFPSDISLAADPVIALKKLHKKMVSLSIPQSKRVKEIEGNHQAIFQEEIQKAQEDGRKKTITKRYLSYCVGQVVDQDSVIFNEYPLTHSLVSRTKPHSWFENSSASGLGWALGAAIGAKLAAPDKTIVAAIGDGTLLFNTPLSAFNVAASYRIPILVIVFNDTGWSTIQKTCLEETSLEFTQDFPLCFFGESIRYEDIAQACGLIGMRVEEPTEVLHTLRVALQKVQEGITVVLNVICERDV